MALAHSLLTPSRCLNPSASTRVTPAPGRPCGARSKRLAGGPALMTVGLIAVVSALVTGCFTHPINRAPSVLSIDLVAPFARGGAATFTALTSDPDSDTVVVSWAAFPGTRPP